jgi:D-alanine--poly(phosphoribitol) ligase subunit 2
MTETVGAVVAHLSEEHAGHTFAPETELIESGVLDSIALIKLIQFIESQFGITVPDVDVDPEIFATPTTIAAYVERRKAGG